MLRHQICVLAGLPQHDFFHQPPLLLLRHSNPFQVSDVRFLCEYVLPRFQDNLCEHAKQCDEDFFVRTSRPGYEARTKLIKRLRDIPEK